MKNLNEIKQLIDRVSRNQFFGVLATTIHDKPYTTLVAFALDDSLTRLFFATPRDTKKFFQLTSNNYVSFLIHNSSNTPEDVTDAVGITITGRAYELSKGLYEKSVKHFLGKHPQLEEFVMGENTAFISLEVDRYDVVERFQNVTVIDINKGEESL